GDDPASVGVEVGRERVAGPAFAGVGVDSQHGAVEVNVAAGPQRALRAQRATFGAGWFEIRARRSGWVATGVAELAPVGGFEAGTLAPGDEQRPFGTELEIPDRVRGELHAPVFEQHVLRRRGGRGDRFVARAHGHFDQPATDHAAGDRGRTGVAFVAGAG